MVEWISVKDRLPEKNGEYLIVYRYFGYRSIKVCSFSTDLHRVDDYIFKEHRPGWYVCDSEVMYYERTGVSHWAELPEMPEDN